MFGIIIGWAFGGFLYFKIAFEAAYYDGIGIIASMLLGIVLGGAVFAASGAYAKVFLKYNLTPGAVPVGLGSLFGKSIIPFMIVLVIFSVICRLIIFGFDDDLSEDLRITFVFITFVPIFLHNLMCVWETHKTANSRRKI